MDINGKVVIVTGASSGIGAATARLLGAKGAKVVLAARREDRLWALAEEISDALAVVTDVTLQADLDRLVEATLDRHGRIDVLVNNAGQGLYGAVADISLADYEAIVALNVYAPLRLTQMVVPHMRAQGRGMIVNISSGTTRMILPGAGAYASTKNALNMLSQVARAELAPDGIDVVLILPFITETEFVDKLRGGSPGMRGAMPPGHSAEFVAGYSLRSIVTGETDVALRPGMPEADV